MHLSTVYPTIPLPRDTRGYQGVLIVQAGPRVGHLTRLLTDKSNPVCYPSRILRTE